MNRLIAALAAFALPAAAAAYVTQAPLGGAFAALDTAAAGLASIQGRDVAVFGLVGLGIVLALLAALIAGRGQTDQPLLLGPSEEIAEDQDEEAAVPVAAGIDPAVPEDRIVGLRRSALADPAPTLPEPAPSTPPIAPVILVRKARERDRDWFADSSWLGGLPRLGDQPWPRDSGGVPLPFVAQIDLAELAAARPQSPLPRTGSLAFFLGAVIAVPEGADDFAEPPHDLPPAYDEGGAPLPTRITRLSRWFFPFWPVEPVPLHYPAGLDGDATERAMAGQLQRHAALRDHPFYAAGVGAPVEALWWHSVTHLADQLHEALDAAARPVAARRDALARGHAQLARLRIDPQAPPYATEDAEEELAALDAELQAVEAQSAALPAMIEALDGFIADRSPWTQLTAEERAVVADILSELHENYGEVVQGHVPGSVAQLATLSARVLVSGPAEALEALPEDLLARINRDYRLAPVEQHRMFGPDMEDGQDILLLQLGYDDLMEWSWSETGTYRFRIGAQDAQAGNWSAVRVTFEDA